jgi:hypothetical protein
MNVTQSAPETFMKDTKKSLVVHSDGTASAGTHTTLPDRCRSTSQLHEGAASTAQATPPSDTTPSCTAL